MQNCLQVEVLFIPDTDLQLILKHHDLDVIEIPRAVKIAAPTSIMTISHEVIKLISVNAVPFV